MLTIASLALIAGVPVAAGSKTEGNIRSILAGLEVRGERAGLNRWHRLAHYVGQLAHESGRFKYDEEIWGPTDAQKRYEDRADLGHSTKVPGEAFMFRGRMGIQNTGRANYRGFTGWARTFDPNAPDFEADPDAVLTDPWEGLGPIWYWESRGLNRRADANDIENLTRDINGGLNGYADRLTLYSRAALVFLGYAPTDVRGFQKTIAGLKVDGIPGPYTRAQLHAALVQKAFAATQAPTVLPASTSAEETLAQVRALVCKES